MAAYAADAALAVILIGLEVLVIKTYKKRKDGDQVTVV